MLDTDSELKQLELNLNAKRNFCFLLRGTVREIESDFETASSLYRDRYPDAVVEPYFLVDEEDSDTASLNASGCFWSSKSSLNLNYVVNWLVSRNSSQNTIFVVAPVRSKPGKLDLKLSEVKTGVSVCYHTLCYHLNRDTKRVTKLNDPSSFSFLVVNENKNLMNRVDFVRELPLNFFCDAKFYKAMHFKPITEARRLLSERLAQIRNKGTYFEDKDNELEDDLTSFLNPEQEPK